MVYAVAKFSNYARDDNFHDAIHFYNYPDNSYVLSFINKKFLKEVIMQSRTMSMI